MTTELQEASKHGDYEFTSHMHDGTGREGNNITHVHAHHSRLDALKIQHPHSEDGEYGPSRLVKVKNTKTGDYTFHSVYQSGHDGKKPIMSIRSHGVETKNHDRHAEALEHHLSGRRTAGHFTEETELEESVIKKSKWTDGTTVTHYSAGSMKIDHPEKEGLKVKWNKSKLKYMHPEHGEINASDAHGVVGLYVKHGASLGMGKKSVKEETELQEFNAYVGKVMKDGEVHHVWQKHEGGYDYEIQNRKTGKKEYHKGNLEGIEKKGYSWVEESFSFKEYVEEAYSAEKIKSALADTEKYIEKESKRDSSLRPKDVQDRLNWYMSHRDKLRSMLKNAK